jgi:hypothetical protein
MDKPPQVKCKMQTSIDVFATEKPEKWRLIKPPSYFAVESQQRKQQHKRQHKKQQANGVSRAPKQKTYQTYQSKQLAEEQSWGVDIQFEEEPF